MPDDRALGGEVAGLPAADQPLLRLADIAVRRDGVAILDHVDLTVSAGEIVTLIGPNGAGKTTLVRVALGLIPIDRGEIRRAAGLTIGYMPQRFEIDETMPLDVRRFLSMPRGVTAADVAAAATEVGIAALLASPLRALSGGELQRTLLARALLRRPRLLVLDEPVRGVDVGGQLEFYEMIADLRRQRGCGVLMVSHDLHLVMAATDRVICLNRHICCQGQPEAVSAHPEYLALFGARSAERIAVYSHRHDHEHGLHGEVRRGEPPGHEDRQRHDHGGGPEARP